MKDSDALVTKVCFVSFVDWMYDLLLNTPGTKTGGAELQQMLLSNALLEQGIDVEFLLPAKAGRPSVTVAGGITLHAGILPDTGPKYIRALPPITSTIRSLRRIKADLYHMWLPCRESSIVALYCMIKRIPYVFAIMSNMDLDGTAERRLGFLDRWLYHLTIRRAALITTETTHELDLLQQKFGRKGLLVRNLCRMPDDANAETRRDLILWVGSFRSLKRPDMFVDLASRMPEHQFIMVGGPFRSEPELFERVAKRAEDIPNLRLVGQLPPAETQQYYRRAIVSILTSEVEGFPNVLLEAWRQGTPVVSTFDPDGVITRYGLGYCADDLDGLEAGLSNLVNDQPERVSVGRRAIKYVKEHHDPEVIARTVIQHIRHLEA